MIVITTDSELLTAEGYGVLVDQRCRKPRKEGANLLFALIERIVIV